MNTATLGSWISDLLHEPIEGRWDMIAQVTGSNDVLHGIEEEKFIKDCKALAKKMSKHTNKVVIAGPGEISTVPIFPWWMRLVFKKREVKVAGAYKKAAESVGAVYANTLEEPRLTKNLGPDRMHLSGKGDKILFEFIWNKILERGWFAD